MSKPETLPTVVEVVVRDVLTGDEQTAKMPAGEYLVLTTEPASWSVQEYANGTRVVTIKGCRPGLSL